MDPLTELETSRVAEVLWSCGESVCDESVLSAAKLSETGFVLSEAEESETGLAESCAAMS